jgi:hypothetical protein
LKPDLVNHYSHLLVLRYALNAVHIVKIRYDKRFVKKNLKIFFPPRFCRGEGNSSSLSYNSAVITRTPELPAPAVVGMLKINF